MLDRSIARQKFLQLSNLTMNVYTGANLLPVGAVFPALPFFLEEPVLALQKNRQ
jgi:hypothetical protein